MSYTVEPASSSLDAEYGNSSGGKEEKNGTATGEMEYVNISDVVHHRRPIQVKDLYNYVCKKKEDTAKAFIAEFKVGGRTRVTYFLQNLTKCFT